MPRWARWCGIGAAGVITALAIVVGIVLIGANTAPGRALVTRLVPHLTGGTVHLAGLSGRLPGALRVDRVWLTDASGTYLTAEDVVLEWEPLRLFDRKVVIDRLSARRVNLSRLPPAEKGKASTHHAARRPGKPIKLVIRRLTVADLSIAPALAGRPIRLALTGSGERGWGDVDALVLDAEPLEGGGHYRIEAKISPETVSLNADIEEPEHGLLAGLAKLAIPGLAINGPIRFAAHLEGPRSAIATRLTATLGPITAAASGRIDLAQRSADLRLTARAGAMQPEPGMGWETVTLRGKLDGPFTEPNLSGLVEISDLRAFGAQVSKLSGKLSGSAGEARLEARLAGITVPGPAPAILAKAPVLLDASVRLDQAGRPLSFRLHHPLISIEGEAETAGERRLAATITLPDLGPIAAIMHARLAGSASIHLEARERPSGFAVSSTSRLALSDAPEPALALLGPKATLRLAAEIGDGTAAISRMALIGAGIFLQAKGKISAGASAIQWRATLPELGRMNLDVAGRLNAQGTIEGPADALALAARLSGTLGAGRLAPQPFQAELAVDGLPGRPSGRVSAEWKSVHANGTVALGKGGQGKGEIRFGIENLGDFSALAGAALAGSAAGTLAGETGPGGPRLEASLRLRSVRFGRVAGSATLTAKGQVSALAVRIEALATEPAPARLTADAMVDTSTGNASLSALALTYRGLSARLSAPARIVFRPGIAIRGLRLAAAGAELEADGSVSPHLALDLSLRNATPALIHPFMPQLAIKGRLDARAKISGSLTAPRGRIEAEARELGLASELGAGLPPADLTLNATMTGHSAQVRAELAAGRRMRVRLAGTAPLESTGRLDLDIDGRADLALLEPAMAASGRQIAGKVALNANVSGTLAAPAIAGHAVLSGGSIADYESGLALDQIGGTFEIAGGRMKIGDFTAHAGPGTIKVAGSIGLLDEGIPIALRLVAHDAELLQSDRITIWLDSELQLTGFAERQLAVGGSLHLRRAEIAIPKSLPPEIAVLKVVRPGARPPPPSEAPPNIALNVTLDAPRKIFVRGRGVDAEFGGRIHVSGTAAAPQVVGSFRLIRGAVSLAGQTLNFTSGTIGFNGGDPGDPTLDLVATTANRATTATLALGGTVRKPTVKLSSVPELPQDQVLAALLFGGSASSLSPFQIAELANALTSLTGTGPSVGNPLGTIRKSLGLDQLSVGSDQRGNPTLQAGRYIAPGVYVGASQSSAGGGAQAQVKIDLSKRLKLEATTGSGGGSAAAINSGAARDTRNGSSIGLVYQFEY